MGKGRQGRFLRVLLVISLCGGVLRVVVNWQSDWIGYDEANYLMIARNWSEGHGFVQSPLETYASKFHLLSFLVPAALGKVVDHERAASRTLFIVLGTLTVFLVGSLGAGLFDERAGVIAAMLAAGAPVLSSLLVGSISHHLFLPAYLGALWLAWRSASGGGAACALASGLLVGISWWARADGLVVMPAVATAVFVCAALRRNLRRAFVNAGSFVAAFAVCYAMYSMAVGVISGGAVRTSGTLERFLVDPPECEKSMDWAGYSGFFEVVLKEPDCVMAAILRNVDSIPGILFTWTGFPLVFLPLVGVGWVSQSGHSRRHLAAHALVFLAVLPITFYLPFFYRETRYIAPYAAVMFIWSALGLGRLSDPLRSYYGAAAAALPTALATLFLLVVTTLHVPRMMAMAGLEYEEAGEWISLHTSPEAVLWTSQSQIAFYAHRAWSYPPAPDELRHALPVGVESVLAIDQRRFAEKNRGWESFLNSGGLEEFDRIYETSSPGPAVTVYRLTWP